MGQVMEKAMQVVVQKSKVIDAYQCLIKRKHQEGTEEEYSIISGMVMTPLGIVDIDSWCNPLFKGSKKKATFFRFVHNGQQYDRRWYHYNTYTETGLCRVAHNFTKEVTAGKHDS